MPRAFHSSWFDHPNNICWGARKLKKILCIELICTTEPKDIDIFPIEFVFAIRKFSESYGLTFYTQDIKGIQGPHIRLAAYRGEIFGINLRINSP